MSKKSVEVRYPDKSEHFICDMVARSDCEHYMKLVTYEPSATVTINLAKTCCVIVEGE